MGVWFMASALGQSRGGARGRKSRSGEAAPDADPVQADFDVPLHRRDRVRIARHPGSQDDARRP